jgi:hypothetical protein
MRPTVGAARSDARALRQWLHVRVHCTGRWTRDRRGRPIVPGGSYRRDNVQPACRGCNASRSNRLDWTSPLAMAAAA